VKERRSVSGHGAVTEAVVIGGGVIGSSIAYHLAKAGVRTILLEKRTIAAAASGASAGGVRQQGRDPRELPLSILACARWATLEDELVADVHYRRKGHLSLIEREEDRAGLVAAIERQRAAGLNIVLVEGDDLRALAPAVSPHLLAGSYTPDDGHANPGLTTQAFAAAAARAGAEVRTGVTVHGLAIEGGRVTGVLTDDGPIGADVTILAAGAWSKTLAATAGIDLPIAPMGLQMLLTAPAPPCLDQVVGCAGRRLSFKQLPAGNFLIGGGWPGDWSLDQSRGTPLAPSIWGSALTASAIIPVAATVGLADAWVGIEARAADDVPILGPVRGLDGLVVAAGFSGHGFQLSPAIGQLIGELIVEGAPSISLDALALDRFDGVDMAKLAAPFAG
jgi:sarcosine oxidase subunit beta